MLSFFLSKCAQINGTGQVGEGPLCLKHQVILATWAFARRDWAEGSITALFASSTRPVPSIWAFSCKISDKMPGGLVIAGRVEENCEGAIGANGSARRPPARARLTTPLG